jgi:putative acetyltransferase
MTRPSIQIRPFRAGDARAVRALFARVNRALAPQGQADRFERYIESSIAGEIGRIAEYYAPPGRAGFWVAMQGTELAGFFGLEPAGPDAAELRRMYVAPEMRRMGLGRALLAWAEKEALKLGYSRLDLSTSELQGPALALYRQAGYQETGAAIADAPSNKTIGGGVRRHHFAKRLGPLAEETTE